MKWISFKEKHPKDFEKILYYNEMHKHVIAQYDGGWIDNDNGCRRVDDSDYWMPLPKPPIE